MQEGDMGLPSAGYAREEELKKRLDALEQQAEEQADRLDVHSIEKPDVLEPDRELQHLIREHDALSVSNKIPGYAYCWVYTGIHGQMVWRKKFEGWEVVQGNDPEAKEYSYTDTSRRVGDTILMRIPLDKHALLVARSMKKAKDVELSISSELEERASKTGGKIIVHTDPDTNPHMATMEATARQQGAKNVALQHVDSMLRRGTMPGMPKPGQE